MLLVALFLDWYSGVGVRATLGLSAWDAFEITDVLLAALAIAALVGAVGLLTPDADYLDRRWLPCIIGAAFVLVTAAILDPPPGAGGLDRDTGAWLAFAGTI